LHLTVFPAKGNTSYRQIISGGLYIHLNKLVHSLAKHFQTLVNKLNTLCVDYFNFPWKLHHGLHKIALWAACLRPLFQSIRANVSFLWLKCFLWKLGYHPSLWNPWTAF